MHETWSSKYILRKIHLIVITFLSRIVKEIVKIIMGNEGLKSKTRGSTKQQTKVPLCNVTMIFVHESIIQFSLEWLSNCLWRPARAERIALYHSSRNFSQHPLIYLSIIGCSRLWRSTRLCLQPLEYNFCYGKKREKTQLIFICCLYRHLQYHSEWRNYNQNFSANKQRWLMAELKAYNIPTELRLSWL